MRVVLALTALLASATLGAQQSPLIMTSAIELPGVEGRIDHLALDRDDQRLFVAVKDEHHGLFLSENPRKGLFDGSETAFPERSSRQCWIGLFGSEHTSYPERAFNPE